MTMSVKRRPQSSRRCCPRPSLRRQRHRRRKSAGVGAAAKRVALPRNEALAALQHRSARAQPQSQPRPTDRQQSARWCEGAVRASRCHPLQRAHGGRAHQRAAQGRIRRPPCDRQGQYQGHGAPHVRGARAVGRSVDAIAKMTRSIHLWRDDADSAGLRSPQMRRNMPKEWAADLFAGDCNALAQFTRGYRFLIA